MNNTQQVESWIDIDGFETIYQVSNTGRIRSLTRISSSGRKLLGKIRKQAIDSRGYYQIKLCKNSNCTTHLVHRIVAKAFIPAIAGKEYINHIDGNKLNNHYTNLQWVTCSENVQHAFTNGLCENTIKSLGTRYRNKFGEKHNCCKYSDEQIKQAITLYQSGMKQLKICAITGIKRSSIDTYLHKGKAKNNHRNIANQL
jgi:hypothetical protein